MSDILDIVWVICCALVPGRRLQIKLVGLLVIFPLDGFRVDFLEGTKVGSLSFVGTTVGMRDTGRLALGRGLGGFITFWAAAIVGAEVRRRDGLELGFFDDNLMTGLVGTMVGVAVGRVDGLVVGLIEGFAMG